MKTAFVGQTTTFRYPFYNLAQVPITGLEVKGNVTAFVDNTTIGAVSTGYVDIVLSPTAVADKKEVLVTLTSVDFGISVDLKLFVTVK